MKKKNPVGRPKKPIDYATVEKLASIMCTQEEIASYLGLDVRTLQRDDEFCRIFKRGIDKGKMSVRRSQYKLAEAGNATMCIWLGKQYLGQRDTPAEVVEKKLELEKEKFEHAKKQDAVKNF